MCKTFVVVVGCLFVAGCSALPVQEGKTSYASYVGDSYSLALEEVVVSVPMADKPNQYQNLHVFLSAIVNPEKQSSSRYEVGNIVRRSSIRLSSVVVQELSDIDSISVNDLPSIRKRLVSKAQQAFDSIFSKWTYSEEFKVEIVIVSFFLTDGSVGKATPSSRFWWE